VRERTRQQKRTEKRENGSDKGRRGSPSMLSRYRHRDRYRSWLANHRAAYRQRGAEGGESDPKEVLPESGDVVLVDGRESCGCCLSLSLHRMR
jgi:hypothetical protein